MVGFAALALTPTLGVIAAFQILRRAADYAIARPTREIIYTVVSREDRYKAKGFIELSSTVSATRSAPGRRPCLAGLAGGPAWRRWLRSRSPVCGSATAYWLGRRQERVAAAEAVRATV